MAVTRFVSAWRDARRVRTMTPADIASHQQALWRRMPFDAYAAFRGRSGAALTELPVIDIATFRARFADYNRLGLSLQTAQAAAAAGESGQDYDLPQGVKAGFSTGTSGATRGVFLTDADERAAYIGQLLAKLLSPAELMRTNRIALSLRAGNDLYRPVHAPCLRARFFPLTPDLQDLINFLQAFRPDVLIAPPQLLLALAASGKATPYRKVFYGAETLNAVERAFITDRLGVRPDPVYQATEGFLGAPCAHGTLHLNEDSLIIEREALDDQGRFRPIVTDLRRRTQAVVRLRLDDILQATTCTCGSPLAAVRPVSGRLGDTWHITGRILFPDEIEARVSPHIAPDRRWIATASPDRITVACPDTGDSIAIARQLAGFGLPVIAVPYDPAADFPKRRHVRWQAS